MTPALLRAFRATSYGAGGAAVRVGCRSVAMDRVLGAREGAFMTAWNPAAQRRPEGWNRRRNQALQCWLCRLTAVPGIGRGRGWQEEHWLVVADPRRVAVMARRFRQAAIMVVKRGQPARLRLLPLA